MFRSRDKSSVAQLLSRKLQARPKLSLRPEYSKSFNAPNTINFIRVALEDYNDTIFRAMWEIKKSLQYVFQTKNPTTLCIGFCNDETDAVLSNLIEHGDKILIGIIGEMGKRAAEIGKKYGARVYITKAHVGDVLQINKIEACLEKFEPKLFLIAHGDCSTGVLQPLDKLGALCHEYNCLFVVDATNTLGAVDLQTDNWNIDVTYSSSQKALGSPSGLVPITIASNALMKIAIRRAPIKNSLWDIKVLSLAWHSFDETRYFYSELTTVENLYALRDSLHKIEKESLPKVIERHSTSSKRLQRGLENTIGLDFYVQNPKIRLPTVILVKKPHGVDEAHFLKYLSERHSISISSGVGITKGHVFRIALMHENATKKIVDQAFDAIYDSLKVMIPTYIDSTINQIEMCY